VEFDEYVKQRIATGDYQALVNYQQYGRAAQLSVPTNDHYLPMLYTLGLLEEKEGVNFTYEEVLGGSISMRCFESAS
jgi:4,5-DOPA dioxygenase extradiol